MQNWWMARLQAVRNTEFGLSRQVFEGLLNCCLGAFAVVWMPCSPTHIGLHAIWRWQIGEPLPLFINVSLKPQMWAKFGNGAWVSIFPIVPITLALMICLFIVVNIVGVARRSKCCRLFTSIAHVVQLFPPHGVNFIRLFAFWLNKGDGSWTLIVRIDD